MKSLQKLLVCCAMVVGLSIAAHAQKGGDGKKPPPKGTPPVVTPQPKNPPSQRPPDDKKPKKPNAEMIFVREED